MRMIQGLTAGLILAGAVAIDSWVWALSRGLALLALGVGLLVAAGALWATSPTQWGDHGRKGPRARQDGRRQPNGPNPYRGYPR